MGCAHFLAPVRKDDYRRCAGTVVRKNKNKIYHQQPPCYRNFCSSNSKSKIRTALTHLRRTAVDHHLYDRSLRSLLPPVRPLVVPFQQHAKLFGSLKIGKKAHSKVDDLKTIR